MYSFLMLAAGAFVLVMAGIGVISAKACSAIVAGFREAASDTRNARLLTKYNWCKDVVEKCRAADEELKVIDDRCKALKAYHKDQAMPEADQQLFETWQGDRDRIIELRNQLVTEYNDTIKSIGSQIESIAPPASIKLPQELKPYVSP